MKTFIAISAAALVASLASQAQVSDTPVAELTTRGFTITPERYSADGIEFASIIDDESKTITILDHHLNVKKTFNYPSLTYKSGQVRYLALPVLEERESPRREYLGSGYSGATAESYVKENYGEYACRYKFPDGSWGYVYDAWHPWKYGFTIPTRYCELTVAGDLFFVEKYYSEYALGYTDQYVKDENWYGEIEQCDVTPKTFDVYTAYSSDLYLGVTQGLFTEDGSYVYAMIVPKDGYEKIYGGEEINGNYEYMYLTYGSGESDLMLYNDKGALIQSVTIQGSWPDMYIIGGNCYIESGDKFYAIDSKNSAVREVAMPSGVKVTPRAMRRSTPVRVELGEGSSQRTVTVRNAAGASVWSGKAGAESSTVEINTSRFESGMYVVTVTDGQRTVENCKIVVK